MKIRLLTILAGPDGCKTPGEIIDVSPSVGNSLIAVRSGEAVDDLPAGTVQVEKAVEVETAMIEPEEKQVIRRRRRKS